MKSLLKYSEEVRTLFLAGVITSVLLAVPGFAQAPPKCRAR